MSDDALKLPIEFPGEDRVQLALTEVLKSLGAVERQILQTGAASEANAKRILALTQAFADGHKTATELRAELVALAGDVPKTAAALRSEAASAAKELAAAEKKAADEAAALAEKQKLIDDRAREMGASLGESASRLSGLGESAVNVAHGLGLALGGMVALGAGTVALLRTIGEASAGAELHQRALASLGGAHDLVQRATNGTISATDTYHARMNLLNAGIRVTDRDLAAIIRHAREHGDVMKTTAERVEELTEALQGGEQDGLQKFGIAVDSTRTRAENLASAIQQMTRAAGENAPQTRTMGEELERFNESLTLGGDAFGAFVDHATGARGAMRELGEEVRRVSQDILDLIDRENQLPQQQRAQAERTRASAAYTGAQRGITAALTAQGFTEEQARGLVPSTALGRLSPEQIAAQARRLEGLRAQLSALSAPANDNLRGRADVAEDLAGIATLGGRAAAPSLGAVDTGAALAGLRRARAGGSQREVTQAQARALLEGVAREMIADAAANDATARASGSPPRSTATNQPGAAQARSIGPLRFGASEDIALARWAQERDQRVSRVGRGRAAEMGADEALTARELAETPAALARLRQLRDREARAREARLDDLRVSVGQAEQVVSLRREEERQSRPLFQVRQRAILAAQADVRHAQQMFTLGVELDRAQDQRAQAQTIAETRLGGRVQRARGRTERAAERADLRNPDYQRERSQDAREERALGRARTQLQDRLDREVSFTERMEDLHTRRAIAAREEAETVSHAFGSMGEAYADHLQAVIAGREDLGTALQGMLADTLAAISKESAIKAGLNLAEGFAALATYRYDAAASHFAAFGLYTGVAVAAGAAGAAIAPAAAPAASGAAEQDRGRALDTGRGPANDNGRGTTIIEQHYYSPVIGGRDATDGEVGRGMQRYASAADRRRLARTGTGP